MNKKQFEHIENRIREAAEHIQPPLNEEAWLKMDQLLDKEMQHQRRRGGFWLPSLLVLILLITASGIYYYGWVDSKTAPDSKQLVVSAKPSILTESKPNGPSVSTQGLADKQKEIQQPKVREQVIKRGIKSVSPNTSISVVKSTKPKSIVRSKTNGDNDGIDEVRKKIAEDVQAGHDKSAAELKRQNAYSTPNPVKKGDDGVVDPKMQTGVAASSKDDTKPKDATDKPLKNQVAVAPVQNAGNQLTKKATRPESNTQSLMVTKELEKQQRLDKILSRFYFTASLASDVNAVKGSGINNVNAMYGLGVGYNINKRFSFQTGLYGGRKTYTVDSSDYYLKPGYWRMVKIRNIDADCYVISVPLSVRFNITTGRTGKFYAVTGLSSYFMQEETYDYYYNYRNNDSVHHAKEMYGGNTHFMSVLDLSVGYEHRWSKHFSIVGEPYLKLPLQGIGEGKVDLYSAGIMLGLKWTP